MNKMVIGLTALLLSAVFSFANAEEVLLGPSDVVKITVYGNPDLTLETRVSQSGTISFPLLGQVKVGGLAVSAAEARLAGLLVSGGFVKKPQVNILVTAPQSQLVSVLGQVNKPGRYPVDGKQGLIDILALAGGVLPDGGDIVYLIRKRDGSSTKETVDLVKMMRAGDLKLNLDLVTGDVVYVERAARFYIYGEVQKPGAYRLESNMTVQQVLSLGGGLTPRGTERGMRIKRRDSAGNITELRAKQGDLVQIDDVIYVKESLF
ncbi:polysaccharide export protein EpsE [Massilia sp. PWRC2]|uniref:polysaccharide export protein EpsE n=1 Tax=Massilia sp. PWRC2 TaxID=2804626 RepID=UPI003CF5E2A0